jgi:hypothetical protein
MRNPIPTLFGGPGMLDGTVGHARPSPWMGMGMGMGEKNKKVVDATLCICKPRVVQRVSHFIIT